MIIWVVNVLVYMLKEEIFKKKEILEGRNIEKEKKKKFG